MMKYEKKLNLHNLAINIKMHISHKNQVVKKITELNKYN